MSYVITTYGGGELFSLVFNGIAALFKEDNTGMVIPLIRVGLMVGSVYVVILMLFQNQLMEGLKWFLWVVVATNLIFLPKTTIFIHDPLANTKSKVDHVPLALGAFASLVSQVGKAVTEQFESQFSLPDYMPYHQTGTVFASALMRQVGQFRIVDPVFKGNMERFVNQCVVYDAMIGHKYTLTDLQNTPDLWGFVSSKASSILGFLYKEGTNPGGIVTCKAGAQKLNAQWSKAIKEAISIYGSRVNERTLTQSTFTSDLLKGAHLLEVAQRTANDATALLKQEMMINALEESSNNKLSELGSTSNYAATKALLQQRSAYAVAGEIAARTLPLFKNVIEAIEFIQKNPRAWVVKQNGHASKGINYVGHFDDGRDVISLLKNYMINPKMKREHITLQEKIVGVEIGVGRYFNGSEWIGPIEYNIEHKKFFPGDIGPTTSEMGTIAWYDDKEDNKLYKEILAPMKPYLQKINFRGDFEINCIVNENGAFPLEATPRFGSPIIHLHTEIHTSSWGELLYKIAKGDEVDFKWKKGFGIVVLLAVPPFPYTKKAIENHFGVSVFLTI